MKFVNEICKWNLLESRAYRTVLMLIVWTLTKQLGLLLRLMRMTSALALMKATILGTLCRTWQIRLSNYVTFILQMYLRVFYNLNTKKELTIISKLFSRHICKILSKTLPKRVQGFLYVILYVNINCL